MTFQPVPLLSIVGMVFTVLVCFGLPIALLIRLRLREHARISAFFIGALTFVVFALALEQLLHSVVLKVAAPVFEKNIWLYALYGGFAAALFEETGRCVAMRIVMKKGSERQNALMYGAGHGGIEAMLIAGVTYINNLVYTQLINSGKIELTLSSMDAATRASVAQGIASLGTTPSGLFFLAGVERIIAITLHICLSVLIYTAFKRRHKRFVLIAFLLHLIVDAGAILLASCLPNWAVEAAMLVAVLFIAAYALKLYTQEAPRPAAAEPAEAPPEAE